MTAHPSALPDAATLTDEAVAARVCGGERPLFEVLLRRHDQRLFRVARAILGNDAEAEDAVQQSWLLAFSKLSQFAGHSKLSTWLTRIVINEAQARRPRLRLIEEEEMAGDTHEQASRAASPEQMAEVREMAALLETAIDQLSEPHRLVFVLREVQGLSTADAAESMGVSEDVVKVRLHRAKERLRHIIASKVDVAAPALWPFLGARCDRMVAAVMAEVAASGMSPR